MGLTNLYSTDHNPDDSFKKQQYAHNLFEQGRRPHYEIDNTYTAANRVFDTLEVILEAQMDYTNELDGQAFSGTTYPVGDRIYGLFDDNNITVAAGGLVRAYLAYPANSKS